MQARASCGEYTAEAMESQIVKIDATDWSQVQGRDEWTAAVEAGKVLYFPQLSFQLCEQD